jgi:hypothetical protein
MPISKYFKGKGEQVMSDMKDRYGAEDGKRAFYATANKNGMKPGAEGPAKSKRKMTLGQRIAARD